MRAVTSRREIDNELAREMRFHLEMEVEKNLRSGMTPDEARRRALVDFGGVQRFREEVKDEHGSMAGLTLDVRHLLRSLRASPGFALIAILTIALGISITTAVVSIADHVLVRGLPFRASGRLVTMFERDKTGDGRIPSAPTAGDWQRDPGVAQVFEGLTFIRGDGMRVAIGEATETLGTAFVAPEFFTLIGVRPMQGRLLSADDHGADAPRVAVMSHRIWKRRFGGDPAMVGRSISVDSVPTTIVGILPPGAEYPGFAELWIPIAHYRHQEILARRGLHADSRTIARLRPGVDSARATAAMRGVGTRLGAEYPTEQGGWLPAMQPLRNEIIGNVQPMLLALTGAAIAVLLLVCANVAGLLLARLTTRSREFAIRSALGASRRRIIAQLVTESFVLAAIGGTVGVGFAALGIGLTKKFAATRIPRAEELAIDVRVLAIAAAATLITAMLCGLWPAIRATRPRVGGTLRASASGSIGIHAEARMRRALVSTQFALALVLLVGAGLLMQSFRRAATVDVGFEPDGLLSVRIAPPPGAYPDSRSAAALYARLIEAARQVPGVINAGFINHAPFGSAAITTTLTVEGRAQGDSSSQVFYRTVSDSYLPVMRMSMAGGRWFEADDIRSPGGRFIINETLAREHWQGASALGQRITVTRASQARPDFGQPITGTIVGIVADVHQAGQDIAPVPEVYVPYTLETWPWGMLMIHARDGASIPALANAIRSVDPRLLPAGPAGDAAFGRMDDALRSQLEPRRFSMSLIATFALCALVLAAMGMYGVVAHGIAQRTREIGVRKALGATDRVIVSVIFRESLIVIGVGVVLGCAGAWAAARLIRGLLFDTDIADPLAYVATVALLTGVALVATYLPARQATRLQPSIALRAD
jgi:putative ABC transport system permease protein